MTTSSLTSRATSLWSEFQRSGDLTLLNEAVFLLRKALREAKDQRTRIVVQSNLAAVLQARSAESEDAADLRESTDLLQVALANTRPAEPLRATLVVNLATALQAWYIRTGDVDTLTARIGLVRDEIDANPEAANLATLLNMLAEALLELYLAGGDEEELDEAVSAARLAVNLTPVKSVQATARLNTLANVLSARYEATQDLADLDSAISTARHALALSPSSHPDTAEFAANLGALLHSRFEWTAAVSDLDEAIGLTAEAVAPGNQPRAVTLQNRGTALASRFEHRGSARDIDEAITMLQRAVDTLPSGSPAVGDCLLELGRCLSMRFRNSGRTFDIVAAIAALDEVVQHTPAQHPRVADYLFALAEAQLLKYGRGADLDAAERAIHAWERAASVIEAGTAVRLRAARSWAVTAATLNDWRSAAHGYETAICLLPQLSWRSADQADRVSLRDTFGDLPSDAAACMIKVGQPMRALQLLELGRTVLWQWLVGMPTELGTASQIAPELADRLIQIRHEIDHTGPPVVPERPRSGFLARRTALAQEWDQLLAQVRSTSGREDFLRPPRPERLLSVGAHGPVVVLNASRLRCDALVLRANGIMVVPLPELTHDEAVARANEFLEVVSTLNGPETVSDSLHRERLLTDLFAWLWKTIAAPVLEHLGLGHVSHSSLHQLPRIWWCPTGPLAVLPLHAAGLTREDGSIWGLLDHVVPSYTATVSQLANAAASEREQTAVETSQEESLLVSAAATPGLPGLPAVYREKEIITRFAGQLALRILDGGEATTTAVRESIAHKSWVHFSCHGRAKVDQPWRSGLYLSDRRLISSDLAAHWQAGPNLLIVSSCATSLAGTRPTDQPVTLVAGLQYAGARRVVGALWLVRDESSAVVSDHLYRSFGDSPAVAARGAAQCLHDALIELRRDNPHVPSVWACFVHYGL